MKEIKVEEVMTRNPIIIEKEISIMDAAKIMKIERIGSLIVRLSKDEYGIITERGHNLQGSSTGFGSGYYKGRKCYDISDNNNRCRPELGRCSQYYVEA
jgi:Predicted signal-transduction protein containing cAMP-binding and CBS domains